MKCMTLLWLLTGFFWADLSMAETLDTSKSQITFYGTQMGAQVEGQFHRFTAKVHFEPQDLPHSTVHLAIDLGSIDLSSEESEDEIKGAHWFNVVRFPEAIFDSSRILLVAKNRYQVMGVLRIKGVAKALQIPMTLSYDHQQAVVLGQFMLRRTDFNVGDGTWAATDSIKDEVTVRYHLAIIP